MPAAHRGADGSGAAFNRTVDSDAASHLTRAENDIDLARDLVAQGYGEDAVALMTSALADLSDVGRIVGADPCARHKGVRG